MAGGLLSSSNASRQDATLDLLVRAIADQVAAKLNADRPASNLRTTITVPEIAERLGLGEETVYEMLDANEIPHIRHGRRYVISRAAFLRWEDTIGEDSYRATRNRTPEGVV